MCHHELWPSSVSYPFSSLHISLGFAIGKHYQKITIPIFRLVLQNFTIPGCFLYIISCCYLFSLLSFGWSLLWSVDCVLSIWGKIRIPMCRLWLHCLYGLHGPQCPLSQKRLLNLLTHSLIQWDFLLHLQDYNSILWMTFEIQYVATHYYNFSNGIIYSVQVFVSFGVWYLWNPCCPLLLTRNWSDSLSR